MNIDGLLELIMSRPTSSTKPDTTRYASHLNTLLPPLARVHVPAVVGACKGFTIVTIEPRIHRS